MVYGTVKAKINTADFIKSIEAFLKKVKKEASKGYAVLHLTDNSLCFIFDDKNIQECLKVEILKEYVDVDSVNASTVENVEKLKKLLKLLKNWDKYKIQIVYLQVKKWCMGYYN